MKDSKFKNVWYLRLQDEATAIAALEDLKDKFHASIKSVTSQSILADLRVAVEQNIPVKTHQRQRVQSETHPTLPSMSRSGYSAEYTSYSNAMIGEIFRGMTDFTSPLFTCIQGALNVIKVEDEYNQNLAEGVPHALPG